ncbi:hypothetical protein A9Z06_33690 [Rhizobium sp. YK2]|nr:hypothetical protein A9Z06_33690 [Rhizobium sp. YK2]
MVIELLPRFLRWATAPKGSRRCGDLSTRTGDQHYRGALKLHILRSLLLVGPFRYNAPLSTIDGISAKELTRNLRELESARLIKQVAVEDQSAYALTTLGQEIEGPFRALGIFGAALARR